MAAQIDPLRSVVMPCGQSIAPRVKPLAGERAWPCGLNFDIELWGGWRFAGQPGAGAAKPKFATQMFPP
ncbi:hypothetical protein ACN93_15875 [Gordonia paraffinivorans]|nr:hypothetical protein ACN93_15875 [Gordonia paraffinivorans]